MGAAGLANAVPLRWCRPPTTSHPCPTEASAVVPTVVMSLVLFVTLLVSLASEAKKEERGGGPRRTYAVVVKNGTVYSTCPEVRLSTWKPQVFVDVVNMSV